MNEGTHPVETRDPHEIERDIDRTRSSLGRTINELENRLSPGQLIDQALGMARQHGGEFATNLGRSVENHPVPLLLTAVGIAWMMASSNEPRAARSGYTAGTGTFTGAKDKLSGAKERMHSGMESARSAGHAVGERASRARHAVGDTVSHAGETVRVQSERMRAGFGRLMEEQPLLVGAMGVAVGALLGAALPRTESEDRLMGDTRDAAARRIKERATEAYEEVRDRAEQMLPSESRREQQAGTSETSIGSEHTAAPRRSPQDLDELRRDH